MSAASLQKLNEIHIQSDLLIWDDDVREYSMSVHEN